VPVRTLKSISYLLHITHFQPIQSNEIRAKVRQNTHTRQLLKVHSTLKKINKTANGVNYYNVTWIVLVALMSFSMSTNEAHPPQSKDKF
jgi:hypothetical protein